MHIFEEYKMSSYFNKGEEFALIKLKEIEEQLNIQFFCWRDEELIYYLKSFESYSYNNLSKKVYILNKYMKFLAEKNLIPLKEIRLIKNKLTDCINIEKLKTVTINLDQFNMIKSQLENTRDKVIFHLAWEGFTASEIKKIKIENISISKNHIVINDVKGEVKYIKDKSLMQDISNCIKETEYMIFSNRIFSLVKSPYLIKPLKIGTVKNLMLENPSNALQGILIRCSCKGIDLGSLSIEDIKRSRTFYEYNKNGIKLEKTTWLFSIAPQLIN